MKFANPSNRNSSRGATAAPPPVSDDRADIKDLAWVQLTIMDYITAHSDDSSELIDTVKPKLETILRRP